MFSVDWGLSTAPAVAIEWLHTANVKSEGMLEITLSIAVVIPVFIGVFLYLRSGDNH